jgi:hypothetical protein
MESLKDTIRQKLTEANVKSAVSGTSLSKLPIKIKKILVDDLRLSTFHLSQIYFDKHLKQLMIITKPLILDRAAIEKLMATDEFIYLQFMNDLEHTNGLAIVFRYNGGNGSSKKKTTKPVDARDAAVRGFDWIDDDGKDEELVID